MIVPGLEALYGSSMPQFITANKNREPANPQTPGFPYTGTARRPLEEQAAAAKQAHPNLSGGMLTMANKHQADKEIAAAQNEAYWLNQASLQGVEFKPGQEHWTDPMDRFIFGSPEPGSAPIAPMDVAGGGGALLKLGVKAGAAVLGGLMMKNFIKNPPEPGTLFSIFGTGTKAPKLKGGKLHLRFVADKTKGQGFNAFGWGIYFSESKVVSGGYAKTRTWNTNKFTRPLEKRMKELASEQKRLNKEWNKLSRRTDASSLRAGRLNVDANKKLLKEWNLLEEKVRTAKSLNRASPDEYLKLVDENPDIFDSEVVRWMKDDVIPNIEKTGGGSHLKVDIADEIIGERGDKLMDWYVTLNDHPAEVQKKIIEAIRSSTISKSGRHIPDSEILDMWGTTNGGKIYDALSNNFRRKQPPGGQSFLNKIRDIYADGSLGKSLVNTDKLASEALQEAGIVGTRFQSGTLTFQNADIVKTWAKPDNISMNLVIWDQKVLDNMKYLGEF